MQRFLLCALLLTLTLLPLTATAQYRMLSAVHSGKCIDLAVTPQQMGANGANVYQYRCHGDTNQRWMVQHVRGRWFKLIVQRNARCLDVVRSYTNGTNVQTWDCHTGDNQLWTKVPVQGTNSFMLVSRYSGLCLDVSLSNGNLHAWRCHGGTNQRFQFR